MEAQHDIKNAYHEVPMGLGMVVGHFRHRHGNFLKKQSGFGEQVRRLALKSLNCE
jgi:hypothetical protein